MTLDNLMSTPTGNLSIDSSTDNILLSLIIPTYNESKNITILVEKLTTLLEKITPQEYELIIVDDDSPDFTWKVALELTEKYPPLKVIRRIGEKGLSTAVIRGWQVAKGEILGVIDADLQHPPETLLNLWAEINKGADLAVASRNVEGGGVSDWSILRRFLSRGAQTLGLIILPEVIGRVSDPMSGYFLVRRECLIGCNLSPLGYKILIEVLGRGKIRWLSEVGYVFQERQEGESKVTKKQYVDYIHHLIRLRFSLWPISRFLRFAIVGFSGVFIDMIFLFLLSDPSTLALPLTRSKIIASELAIINNFLWNDAWTFRDISKKQPSKRQKIKRFIKFNIVCLAGLIINVLLLNFFFNMLSLNRYLANFIAIAFVTLWNFWLNLKLSWRSTEI
ncbi:glycosyltransferase [Geminocystis sp. GBBB08]|uniref:glycosyltransferase n=1 Tax=Geminocystis sp. GBBB08 TaxID=2604140 RepID=UPI00292875FC|nr:glycosyltransferase [Geminocystis sp. GBBB08]